MISGYDEAARLLDHDDCESVSFEVRQLERGDTDLMEFAVRDLMTANGPVSIKDISLVGDRIVIKYKEIKNGRRKL